MMSRVMMWGGAAVVGGELGGEVWGGLGGEFVGGLGAFGAREERGGEKGPLAMALARVQSLVRAWRASTGSEELRSWRQ